MANRTALHRTRSSPVSFPPHGRPMERRSHSRAGTTQVTKEAGEYLNPVWSPDGGTLAYSRGAGATLRGRDWARNEWYDLVLQALNGGEPRGIVRLSGQDGPGVRAQFGPGGRVYYIEHRFEKGAGPFDGKSMSDLTSVQRDGSDRRVHA